METLLDKLHKDHINFVKLLSFLEKQLQLLEHFENSDLAAMIDAIAYMKEYPDHVHHPLEDVIFKYFIEHYDDARESINDLLLQHIEMPLLTNKLLMMLKDALADIPQSRDELCESMSRYITLQREHMDKEEVEVYPFLKSNLDANDWENIDSELSKIDDPLFGENVKKSYQSLLFQVIG